ncbi:MAG TPA: nucleotide exchange factor GrpE [Ignavibacteria bacterium]|jgi:molecular chaperone GrpE
MKDKDKKIKINIKTPEENISQEKDINPSEENNKPDEIEIIKNQIEEYKDSLLRKAAEFENYKRRTEIELSSYFKYASEKLLRKLIPVFDDMNRAIESIEKGETNDFETLKKGVISIAEKFKLILEKEGLKEIDCLNKEFQVDTCDALLQIPRDDVKPHTVVEVVEKGYYFKDKVLKHAKVIVSSETEKE